jgi:hypothetical protein
MGKRPADVPCSLELSSGPEERDHDLRLRQGINNTQEGEPSMSLQPFESDIIAYIAGSA